MPPSGECPQPRVRKVYVRAHKRKVAATKNPLDEPVVPPLTRRQARDLPAHMVTKYKEDALKRLMALDDGPLARERAWDTSQILLAHAEAEPGSRQRRSCRCVVLDRSGQRRRQETGACYRAARHAGGTDAVAPQRRECGDPLLFALCLGGPARRAGCVC